MIMLEKYITAAGQGQAEIVEKKSRFIANVSPAASEKDAVSYIEGIKKKYWDARHNCYAYQIGEKNQLQRYSDDGEPGGTAGMPILDVLRGRDIKNTVIVVTRYFGGTLLGTGGLVRAYGSAAKAGIEAAGLIECSLYTQIHITVDYTLSGKVQYEVLNKEHIIKDTVYTDKVEFTIQVNKALADSFIEDIVNITSGNAEITKGEDIYLSKKI